jgi:GNAT superfamily N-acetyltransferase
MIRRAVAEDAEAIADVFVAALGSLAFLPVVHTREEHRRFITEVVPRDHELWVAEEDGRLVGLAAVGKSTLGHLYVHPDAQGRGIGSALLAKVKELRPRGFTLWTFPANERACAFYERRGLRAVQFGEGSGNEEGLPDVQYEWSPAEVGPVPLSAVQLILGRAAAPSARESTGRSRGAGSRSCPRRSR